MERSEYAEMGVSTVRGVWILLTTFVLTVINVIAVYAIRTHDYRTTGIAAIWIAGVTIGNIRYLREFDALNLDPRASTTRFVFKILVSMPALGIVPVILLLLR